MDTSEANLAICRLCLFAVTPGTYYKINNFISPNIVSTKEKITSILPEIDLDISSDPIICRECFINVENFYQFKCCCIKKNIQLVCNAEVFGQNVEFANLVKPIREECTKKLVDSQDPENMLIISSVDHNYDPNSKYSQKEIDNMRPSDKIKKMPKQFDKFFTNFINSHPNQTTYTCDICNKNSMSIHTIREHFLVTKHYSKEKYNFRRRPNTCPVCNTTFKSEELYNLHTKKHLRKVRCGVCEQIVSETRLRKHFKKLHLREQLFKCKYCRKAFPLQDTCANHETMHLTQTETAIYCTLCHLYFNNKNEIAAHTKKMH